MISRIKNFIVPLALVGLLVVPYFVFAADTAPLNKLKAIQEAGSGYAPAEETSVASIAGTVVRAFLSLLGVIFLILLVYAGYTWMTAHGEDQKVTKAKDTLRTSMIGLIIVLSAYAIYAFVFEKVIFLELFT